MDPDYEEWMDDSSYDDEEYLDDSLDDQYEARDGDYLDYED